MYKIDYTNVNRGIKYHLLKIIFALILMIGAVLYIVLEIVTHSAIHSAIMVWMLLISYYYMLYEMKWLSVYWGAKTSIKKALENNATLVKGVKAYVHKINSKFLTYEYYEIEVPVVEHKKITLDLISEPKIECDNAMQEMYVDVLITPDEKYYYIDFNIEVEE